MQISVIIPTHNRAHVLARALESVQGQSYKPMETIVVDDGSTDDTSSLVQKHFPDCRYLYQENRGVSGARNRGIEMATGEWLAFLDSDDEWLPDKLATQKASLEAAPAMKLCHTEEIWIRNGRRVNPMKKHAKTGGYIFKNCLPLCAISPSSVVIHRFIFEELGLFDETLPACEDYDLWLRICSRYPVEFINSPQIIKYGGHEDQLSRRHWGMDRFRIQALERIITDPELSGENRQAAIEILINKADIVAQGAEKRGKQAWAAEYREKQRRYASLLPDCTSDPISSEACSQ
jgi:glycosyltransferase involved in cell wall biosynthesis